MALQSQNLVMIGLGIQGDSPPNSIQPPLVDGVHLRWSFKHKIGFPWYGFYLFRRLHRKTGKQQCLSHMTEHYPVGELPNKQFDSTYGAIISDRNLSLTDDFPPTGSVEFDLADRHYLRFLFNPNEPAHQVQVKIGFRNAAKITITCLLWDAPIIETVISGNAGDIETTTFDFDTITSLEIGSGPATLVDLCFVPVSQNANAGWQPVPDFKYPLCLPLTHPDYPCSDGLPVDLATAEAVALDRVRYDLPVSWSGDSFKELHEQMTKLVVDGPTSTPMADRFTSWPGIPNPPDPQVSSPRMPNQRPLDLVLLGAIQPAIAQMLGLYWVDQSGEVAKAYDYLIVADYSNRLDGSINGGMRWLRNTNFTDVDAYIVFNKKRASAAPLSKPNDLRAYALSGSNVRKQENTPQEGSNNTGLRWDRGVSGLGVILPGKPLMYHLWRATLGDAEPISPPPARDYDLITTKRALLVSEPQLNPGQTPQRPQDWPPFPLHTFDNWLAEGWYSYQVNGIDIFGRHTPNSNAAVWYQWQPMPDPKPWYYQMPPNDFAIHPFAIRLLDKMPPPPPTGIEAFALDPNDSTVLRDANFNTWFATLSLAEQESVIGLRVRWQWTKMHQRQAPDVREFRIYLHPGTNLPLQDHSVATNWQERIYVVAYDAHLPIMPDDAERQLRRYDVFLPASIDAFRDGLSLTPTLADPIVYAHIGVSAADDKTHTVDDFKWAAGRWGGADRFGNEGRIGAPAKIFQVRRVLPDPPVPPPPDSDRVFASPADYHSQSFYTYRWQPRVHLKTHIFRALDDALFKTDWTHRPREPLAPDQLKYFPTEVDEPNWTETKRRQVALELNSLNSFVDDDEGKAQAMIFYRGLSNDGLRVLAGLAGNERVFSQITIKPLDPDDSANANRLGPDNPTGFPIDSALRAYIDILDGRATNRYFYRAAYTDGAHNRSELSLSSSPVYLPNVIPPRTPVITKILGGDRQIILRWSSNRESDLSEYHVYRADTKEAARDLRLMTQVHIEIVPAIEPSLRPAEITWSDTPIPGLVNFYYRIIAVDSAKNVSEPSSFVTARSFDSSRPEPPTWETTQLGATPNSIILFWSTSITDFRCLVQRKHVGLIDWENISGWLPKGHYTFEDHDRDIDKEYNYRLRVLDNKGVMNRQHHEITV